MNTHSSGQSSTSRRSGVFASLGAVGAAVAASACCWLPLLLIAFGASAGGVAGWFESYRPLFLTVAVLLLAAGFYLVYRPAPDCGPDDACATPRPTLRRVNQVSVWLAAVLVLAFALFPNYVGRLLPTSENIPPLETGTPGRTVTLSIDGMTCEACAVGLKRQLEQTPGVAAADVDFEEATATVALTQDAAATDDELRSAVERAGYQLAPQP